MNFKIIDEKQADIGQDLIDSGNITRNNLELIVAEARYGDTFVVGDQGFFVRGRHLEINADTLIIHLKILAAGPA